MNKSGLILVLVAGLAAIVGVLAGALLLQPAAPPELRTGTLLGEPRPLPEFQLTAGSGEPFTREDFKGEWQLVFFGFTHCPDVCPNTLFLLDRMREQLAQQSVNPPNVVFVSVDPERDDPAQVAEYVDYFNETFIGVTAHGGNTEALQRLTKAMSVAYEFQAEGDSYTVIHSSALLLVNPDAQLHAIFTPPLETEDIAADIAALVSD